MFDEDGVQSHKPFPPMRAAALHLRIHLFRAARTSIVGGRTVYDVRKTMGARARARGAGRRRRRRAGAGFRRAGRASATRRQSGIPFELGIIRNHYVGRTFIEPTQQIRQLGVRLKHSANRAVVNGKRIVLVDDSIVRGTTSIKIVQMMRDAGATEVHIRIASPPITHPDYLRHRHAGARQAARRHARPRRDARSSSARIRSPSCRSTASTARWATSSAIRCGRNSPTIASPATIRPR